MSMFSRAAAALQAVTAAANGGTVTYLVLGLGQVDVVATFGRSTLVSDDTTDARLEVASEDFIVTASTLQIAGTAVRPASRHVVVVGAGLPRRAGEYQLMVPPYTPCGPNNTLLRLHTKFVGS